MPKTTTNIRSTIASPLNTSSPLDTLKSLVLEIDNMIAVAADHLAGSDLVDDENMVYAMLDSARKMAWDALAEHVDGVRFEYPHYSVMGAYNAHHYDDGSLVDEQIDINGRVLCDYFPRRDGDRTAFVARMRQEYPARPQLVLHQGGTAK